MERWAGITAVVTGASAGIGAAVSVELANAGLKVVGLARRSHLVEKLNSEIKGSGSIQSRQCDIVSVEDIKNAFAWVNENFGGVDILVNNAGVFKQGHITDVDENKLTDEELFSILDINLRGLIVCTRQAVASMKTRGVNGHIVNISSIAGQYIPFSPLFNVYPCSKHAVTAFTQSLNNELAHMNSMIKTTNISPGLVATDMAVGVDDMVALKPKDVADAVLYVISTPPTVNISELTITPVTEKRL